MTTLRLLADDLTGALDSAARFVPLVGTVPTCWVVPPALPATAAIDGNTRETERAALGPVMADLAPLLKCADITFKKIDSLLRGQVVAELNELAGRFDWCILAPAFPFQGRVTRHGRQLVLTDAGWRDVGVALTDGLVGWGDRLMICDAETDADLDAIVARGRALRGRLLWCGTGGLAGALAGRRPVPCPDLPRPMLALIGSDHPVSVAQVAAVPQVHHRVQHVLPEAPASPEMFSRWPDLSSKLPDQSKLSDLSSKLPAGTTAEIARLLAEGAAVASVALPPATSRDLALSNITSAFVDLLGGLPCWQPEGLQQAPWEALPQGKPPGDAPRDAPRDAARDAARDAPRARAAARATARAFGSATANDAAARHTDRFRWRNPACVVHCACRRPP